MIGVDLFRRKDRREHDGRLTDLVGPTAMRATVPSASSPLYLARTLVYRRAADLSEPWTHSAHQPKQPCFCQAVGLFGVCVRVCACAVLFLVPNLALCTGEAIYPRRPCWEWIYRCRKIHSNCSKGNHDRQSGAVARFLFISYLSTCFPPVDSLAGQSLLVGRKTAMDLTVLSSSPLDTKTWSLFC